jgi:hypothetical protein
VDNAAIRDEVARLSAERAEGLQVVNKLMVSDPR